MNPNAADAYNAVLAAQSAPGWITGQEMALLAIAGFIIIGAFYLLSRPADHPHPRHFNSWDE